MYTLVTPILIHRNGDKGVFISPTPLCIRKMKNEPRPEKTCIWGFKPGLPLKRAVKPLKIARGFKVRI